MQVAPADILRFWIDETGPAGWFAQSDALDERIRARFGLAWRMAARGAFEDWMADPAAACALLILLDQFPRNMFRGEARAFATDPRARRVARRAMDAGFDRRLKGQARTFAYLPLEHSESLRDQDAAVRLYAARMTDHPDYLLHARAHREVIRRFGRFPFRNAALGRESTPEEREFLSGGGYMAIVRSLAA